MKIRASLFARSVGIVFAWLVVPLVYAAGENPACVTVSGAVTYESTSTLTIDIGGPTGCPMGSATDYDRLTVNDLILQSGTLQVRLVNNYSPVGGEVFNVLDWDTITGTFGTEDFSQAALPPDLLWDTSQLYTAGELAIGGELVVVEQVPVPNWVLVMLIATLMITGWREVAPLRMDGRQ